VEEAERVIDALGVVPRDPRQLVGRLSGGNQQKVLLGKWLAGGPRLLLLHEPTQAVDVQARQDLLRAIHGVAERGTTVLLASTEPEDLVTVCDRVLIFRNGAIVAELHEPRDSADIFGAVYSTSAKAQRTESVAARPQGDHR
jgi:ribose transport system ATP-binding protein